MEVDLYPPILLRYSVVKLIPLLLFPVPVLVQFAGVASGQVVETGYRATSASEASYIFLIFAGCLFLAYAQCIRLLRKDPAVVISRDGFILSRIDPRPIPWSAIEQVEVRSLALGLTVIKASLRRDLPNELDWLVTWRRRPSVDTGRLVITFHPWVFRGAGQSTVTQSFIRYHQIFGP